MDDELLTTAEAARRAGVAPSSVRRWSDSRSLASVRTAGGHRRFRRVDLEVFLRALATQKRGGRSDAGSAVPWLQLLLHGGPFALQGEVLCARQRLGCWSRVGAEINASCSALQLATERGEVSAAQARMAFEKLAEALQCITRTLPAASDHPGRSRVGAGNGVSLAHELALLVLCLHEARWASE
jgi:excisionase family DNA binding protein